MSAPVSLALFARLAPKQLSATVVGMYSMAFSLANYLVGWIGGWFATMPTTTFWLMHAGFAGAAGAVFVVLKIVLAKRLAQAEAVPAAA